LQLHANDALFSNAPFETFNAIAAICTVHEDSLLELKPGRGQPVEQAVASGPASNLAQCNLTANSAATSTPTTLLQAQQYNL
jgi:hypothetical protein